MNVPKFDDSKKTHLTLEIYSIGRKKNNQDRETLKKEREREREVLSSRFLCPFLTVI